MAEAVVSLALETFRDLLLEEGRFLSGVADEVKALQTQLKEMQSLLKDADGKQHESEIVRNWIAQIRDLAYRAEDVIETYAVEVSSKRGGGLKNLLRRFSCIMKKFHSLHQLGSQISQIKADLAGVSKSMQDYGIRSIIQGESSGTNDNRQWKRQTFPDFQIQDCFVGRDDELKQIVSLLVDDDQHRILSIWGMGGLGKDMTCPAFSFPRLTELELKKLPNLREWRVEEGAMPLLSKIIIIECPELTMLPDGLRFISTLQELIITKIGRRWRRRGRRRFRQSSPRAFHYHQQLA